MGPKLPEPLGISRCGDGRIGPGLAELTDREPTRLGVCETVSGSRTVGPSAEDADGPGGFLTRKESTVYRRSTTLIDIALVGRELEDWKAPEKP